MVNPLKAIAGQLPRQDSNAPGPPLHLWNPELSGEIDIVIERDGRWLHEGRPFERREIVNLFASILRREADGHYYLVTPVEKWRIRVALHPLIVDDVDPVPTPEGNVVRASCNTGLQVDIGDEHPLGLEPETGDTAYVRLDNGLTALLSRAAWLRLVSLAVQEGDQLWLRSGEARYLLGSVNA